MIVQQPKSIPAMCVRFHSSEDVMITPYLVKGALIRTYPNHTIIPYINGELRGQIGYPRVQVKVLRQQLSIFGIESGHKIVDSLREDLKELNVENTVYKIDGYEMLESQMHFDVPEDTFYRYKFITPWVALNRKILAQFTSLMPHERINYLNRLLVQNILFLAREFDLDVPYTISVRLKLQSISPRVVEEQGSGSFKGYFTTNVRLPNYLGLGNGITKGLGTIVGI